ncbi:hypothetical protein ACFQUU_11000 [Herbaspirillum sp. GCM10030257]
MRCGLLTRMHQHACTLAISRRLKKFVKTGCTLNAVDDHIVWKE